MQAAVNKYGWPAFVFEVVEALTDVTLLCDREIHHLEAVPPERRYNLKDAGAHASGYNWTKEARRKVSTLRGGKPFFAVNVETKERFEFATQMEAVEAPFGFLQAHIGSCLQKKRKSHKGFVFHYTDEPVPSMALSDARSREVIGTSPTGVEKSFPSVSATAADGFAPTSISKVLAGKLPHASHWKWRYADGLPHRTHSAEHTKALTDAGKKSRPVVARNIDTGEERTFPYIAVAARELNLLAGTISGCLSGKHERSGRYTFRFEPSPLD